MPPSGFPNRLRHVQPGEPVSASVASRPSRALEGRTNFLREWLAGIDAGVALILRGQAAAPEVQNGQPVYWDAEAQRFDQAVAGVTNDAMSGSLVATPSSDVLGLATNKQSGNVIDVVLYGAVRLPSMAAAIDGALQPGRYYLSGAEPGKLVRQRPPVTVAVCYVLGSLNACDQDVAVYVQPQMRDFLEDHVHYQFELTPLPAGAHTPPALGERHVVTSPDAAQRGWLPADHAVFGGHAPPGAKFGYNLQAHVELEQLWPPIPATAAVLEMLQPANPDVFNGLRRVPADLVVFDAYGIWWLSDCYHEVPWPASLDTTVSSSSTSSVSSSAGDACPAPSPMRLILSFIKMTFATDKTVVTSLQPDVGQPLRFVNCDGSDAKTGDLFARLVLSLLLTDVDSLVGRSLTGIADNRFERSWAVSGLIAGEAIALAGSRTRLVNPQLPETGDNPRVHQGLVRVSALLDPVDRELLPQIVVLGDAIERFYENIPYIGFAPARDSSVRLKFVVPAAGLPASPRVVIRLVLFGRANGTLPELETSYFRLARPIAGSPTAITAGDSPLTLSTAVVVDADMAHEVESAPISIAAGDTLFVSITREAGASPVYDAELGLIRASAILQSGA